MSRNPEILLRAFIVYAGHYLNMPHAIGHSTNYAIDKIDTVQRKFKRGGQIMEYPARLSYLPLQSLEKRRLTADLIFTGRCYASAVLAMGLCPSVCRKSVFYRNG